MTPARSGGPVRSDGGTDLAGQRIRGQRGELGISQLELAKRVDVSRQTIISMERGDYAPSVYLALKVAAALDTAVESIWGHNEPDPVGTPVPAIQLGDRT